MEKTLSLEQFLENKKDYSPYLVHLTKDETIDNALVKPAKDVLDAILEEQTLRGYRHFCYFSEALKKTGDSSLQQKFYVVCFTETPIGQMDVLLSKVAGRNFQPAPYGLVFTKQYIRQKGGNPVFYVTKEIARPLFQLIYEPYVGGKEQVPDYISRLLALITVCEEGNDWHWEREWRIVGDLKFDFVNVFCGLCPEEDIPYFENRYSQVKFISPYWNRNTILSKLVGK
jgi:hypothetical protein